MAARMVATFIGCASSPQMALFVDDTERLQADTALTILCIPLKEIDIRHSGNARTSIKVEPDDSSLLEAARSLIRFEVSQRYKPVRDSDVPAHYLDSVDIFESDIRYSTLLENHGDSIAAAGTVAKLCKLSGANLVLWPYSCSIKSVAYRPRPWRGGGPSYDRPVEHSARSNVHVQIWDREGRLLYERIAAAEKSSPIMYSLFGRKRLEEDPVRYAKRLYASPLIRSLYRAVRRSLD
ncbi:MAG: hypothetical protein GF363_04730 [Chitinivibrionales bacterium]|nr:hypothetical protein [Chitinivibrionales bacterium]